VQERSEDSGKRFVATLSFLEGGDAITVSVEMRGDAAVYRVQGPSGAFEVPKEERNGAGAASLRRRLGESLSPSFRQAFPAVKDWLEGGYLGLNVADLLGTALDLKTATGTSPALVRPLKPSPVDCAFDASFGYPCSSEEGPRDPRGLMYEKNPPPSATP
jgi:hypothetical protein